MHTAKRVSVLYEACRRVVYTLDLPPYGELAGELGTVADVHPSATIQIGRFDTVVFAV